MSVVEKLLGMKVEAAVETSCKVSIIGVGDLGSSIAYTILLKGICNELVLVDTDENVLNGELLDLQQGLTYHTNMNICGSTDPSITSKSKIIILSLGDRPKPGNDIYSVMQKNFEVYKGFFLINIMI